MLFQNETVNNTMCLIVEDSLRHEWNQTVKGLTVILSMQPLFLFVFFWGGGVIPLCVLQDLSSLTRD